VNKKRLLIAALAAAATLALPAASSLAQRGGTGAAVAARDWTRVAVRTPEGGFRLGNPNARIKLVEFLSTTCPACAAFARESGTPLYGTYVRTGRVSVEYRNHYLNGLDIAAALLSRCAAPRAYFDLTHALLASQPQWMGRIRTLTEAQRTELGALQPIALVQRLVPLLGLDAIAARHGITPAIRRQCLTQANLDRLQALHDASAALGVNSTPTFFINGRQVAGHSWAEIEPLLGGR